MNVHVARTLASLPALVSSVDAATAPHGFQPLAGTKMPGVLGKGAKLDGFSKHSFSLLADALSAAAAVVQLSGTVNFEGCEGAAAQEMHGACQSAQSACAEHWKSAEAGGASVGAGGEVVGEVAEQSESVAGGLIASAEAFVRAALPMCSLPGVGSSAAAIVHGVADQLLECLGGIFEARNTCAEEVFAQCSTDLAECVSTPVPECPEAAPAKVHSPGVAPATGATIPASVGTPTSESTLEPQPSVATGAESTDAGTTVGVPRPPSGVTVQECEVTSAPTGKTTPTIGMAVDASVQAAATATLAVAGTVGAVAEATASVASGLLDMNLPATTATDCGVSSPASTECATVVECAPIDCEPVADCTSTATSEAVPLSEPTPEPESAPTPVPEPVPEPAAAQKPIPEPEPELASEPVPTPEADLSTVPEPEPPAGKMEHYDVSVDAGSGPEQTPVVETATSSVEVPSAGEW